MRLLIADLFTKSIPSTVRLSAKDWAMDAESYICTHVSLLLCGASRSERTAGNKGEKAQDAFEGEENRR